MSSEIEVASFPFVSCSGRGWFVGVLQIDVTFGVDSCKETGHMLGCSGRLLHLDEYTLVVGNKLVVGR